MDQDPWAGSWKDQRHPTMGPNLMGLLTLRIRWDWKTICKCFIWKFSVSGGLGGLPGFQQERIGGGEVQQFAPYGATYCWARIVSEIFVQLIFKYLSKNSLKDICTTTDLRVSVSWQRAAFDGAKPPHACWNKKQAWKSFEFWVKILAGWKANLGFSRKNNWYTEKT